MKHLANSRRGSAGGTKCLLVHSFGVPIPTTVLQWRAHYIPGADKFNISNVKLSTGY
ncbi:hypothetical protein PANT111_560087 [Pantoea brenneri]|uniref:Transposase n=1 Tax=Pantoea brenneri TaxID=472694 RepID=A0AAX3JBZ0_9GAMM|nr:hypothetical protein PANT111_560087 [Pantoea brenneri]